MEHGRFEWMHEFNHTMIGGKLCYILKDSLILIEKINGETKYNDPQSLYTVFIDRDAVFKGDKVGAYKKFEELIGATKLNERST